MLKNKRIKKAFTLIELLIVIAIIGILFVVLISRVDFATDKAKATGVQTDFRAFQMAFDTVAKEASGFNMLGWNTGDISDDNLWSGKTTPDGQAYSYANKDKDAGDRIRNSYDVGDANSNGIQESGEIWTGRKISTETWSDVWTFIKPGDTSGYMAGYDILERALNGKLDPTMHITVNQPDASGVVKITMANGKQDPWKKEYEGYYISNAHIDGLDRGAIVLYSAGPNNKFGSTHSIANGEVSISIPGNNIDGQDDMVLISCYSLKDGYGHVKTESTGFGQNNMLAGSGQNTNVQKNYTMLSGSQTYLTSKTDVVFRSEADYDLFRGVRINGSIIDASNYVVSEGSTIVNLKYNYLSTLRNGTYVVEIVSDDGAAKANLIINIPETVVSIKNSLNDYSWNEIQTIAQANLSEYELYSKYNISLGDYKTVGNTKYYLVDLDGNSYDGFVFMYDSNIRSAMNNEYREGNYFTSDMFSVVDGLYSQLLSDLQNVIKVVNVKTTNNGTHMNEISNMNCSLFLPSYYEVGAPIESGDIGNLLSQEGTAFDYLTIETNLMSLLGCEDNLKEFWCRSVVGDYDGYYVYFMSNIDGLTYTDDLCDYSYRVAPCFVVG